LLDAAGSTRKFHIDLQPLEILPVIIETLDSLRPHAILKGVDLTLSYPHRGRG